MQAEVDVPEPRAPVLRGVLEIAPEPPERELLAVVDLAEEGEKYRKRLVSGALELRDEHGVVAQAAENAMGWGGDVDAGPDAREREGEVAETLRDLGERDGEVGHVVLFCVAFWVMVEVGELHDVEPQLVREAIGRNCRDTRLRLSHGPCISSALHFSPSRVYHQREHSGPVRSEVMICVIDAGLGVR